MEKIIEIGLSGWIIFIASIFLCGGIAYRHVTRRKIRQSNIAAGGDVAGGNILKGTSVNHPAGTSNTKTNVVQSDIRAGGDVAGGNIVRDDK